MHPQHHCISTGIIAVFGFTARAPQAQSSPGTIKQTCPQRVQTCAGVQRMVASFLDACTRSQRTSTFARSATFVHPMYSTLHRVINFAFGVSTTARCVKLRCARNRGAQQNCAKSNRGSEIATWIPQAQRKIHRWPPEQRDVHRRPPQEEPRRALTTKMSCI
jgi:hypothetical protein